jgi:hypothetical protein
MESQMETEPFVAPSKTPDPPLTRTAKAAALMLMQAELELGLCRKDGDGMTVRERAMRILGAARGSTVLDPPSYKLAWVLSRIIK